MKYKSITIGNKIIVSDVETGQTIGIIKFVPGGYNVEIIGKNQFNCWFNNQTFAECYIASIVYGTVKKHPEGKQLSLMNIKDN
jgi:hypothetical protein